MNWRMRSKGWLVFLGFATTVLAVPSVTWSQAAEWTVYNTTNSGLPYNSINALAVDAQGTAWIGTGWWGGSGGGGLARFDGEHWTVYNTANSRLPNNDHNGLAIDAQGNIWCATEGGLAIFDRENWVVYTTQNSGLPQRQVHGRPVFDSEDRAWLPTFGGGLALLDGEDWTVYNTGNSGLPHNRLLPLAFDAQENLWIGTWGGGLAQFDGDNWTAYHTGNSGLPNNSIVPLAFDAQGNLWIGTQGGGLAKFDDENWTVYNTSNSGLPYNSVLALMSDAHGNLWIGTGDALSSGGAGLARFDGQHWTVYNTSNSGLPHNGVCSLALDAQENVWIGTRGGLAVYRPLPAVDLNNDGIVDCADMCTMLAHWHTDEPSCDIAPTPFGDGIVDVQDLVVLTEHLFTYPGAVAHWKLDETEGDVAYDSAALNDASVMGHATWQPDTGQIDGALQFDGIDDYVQTPHILDPADGVFSIFAWIKGGLPGQVILSQDGASDWLLANRLTGCLECDVSGTGRRSQALTSETTIADGNWHHVGLVWDGFERILYVDDSEVARDTQPGLAKAKGGLFIGASADLEEGAFWSGMIDHVRIYDRVVTP